MEDSLNIESVESIYKALNGRDEIRAKAHLMLLLRNWLTEVLKLRPCFPGTPSIPALSIFWMLWRKR